MCLLSLLLPTLLLNRRGGALVAATTSCDSTDPKIVLTKAAYYEPGDDELIECYLDHKKLDIETADADERTAMHHACLHGNMKVVRLLVERDAALNRQDKYGYTPVMWAAKGGYADIVAYLLQKKVVLDKQDIAGYTALMHATLFDRTEAAITVIEDMETQDMDAQEGEYGHTALHLSAFYGEHQIRISLYYTILYYTILYYTILYYTCSLTRKLIIYKNLTLILYSNEDRDVLAAVILLYGADPTVQDFEGNTAAELARMNGNRNVLKAMEDPEEYLRGKGYHGSKDDEL